MKKIGITGSLASGKTTASKILSMRKGPLFSADDVVKKLYTKAYFRKILSRDAFLETGYYDTKITDYLNKANNDSLPPKKKLIGGNLVENLRYGENPHQSASVYSLNKEINIKQLNGKKLSYNNYNDIFTGISL